VQHPAPFPFKNDSAVCDPLGPYGPRQGADSGGYACFSEPAQAVYLSRLYLTSAIAELPITIYYEWRDAGPAAGPNQWVNNWGTVYGDGVDPWLPRHPKPAYHAAVAIQETLGGRRLVRRLEGPHSLFDIGPPPQCPACTVPPAADIFVLEFGKRKATADSDHAFAAWLGILWPINNTMVQLTFVVPAPPAQCYTVRTHLGERAGRLCTSACAAGGSTISCLVISWGVSAAPIYISRDAPAAAEGGTHYAVHKTDDSASAAPPLVLTQLMALMRRGQNTPASHMWRQPYVPGNCALFLQPDNATGVYYAPGYSVQAHTHTQLALSSDGGRTFSAPSRSRRPRRRTARRTMSCLRCGPGRRCQFNRKWQQ
jgi:hypothetical protein